MKEVEIKAVDTIIDKGVRVPVPAPFFLRLFVKNISMVIKRPVLGNMLRISKMYLSLNVPDDFGDDYNNWLKLFKTKAVPVSRIVAIGMLRGKFTGWLFCRLLAHYLRWNLDSRELAKLAAILVSLSGVQDFLNTIKFLRTMKITQPRNMSQDEKGS